MSKSVRYGTLFSILVLGIFLRVYGLEAESLWQDEGASLWFAGFGPTELIGRLTSDNNPPGYYLLLHYWVSLFGDSDFFLRLPSTLAGILAIVASYKLGALLFGRTSGVLAALILAVSPFHVQYSQEARAYELAALFALLSFYFFVRVLRERGFAPQAGYVLCTCALVYSHFHGLFVVLAQALCLAAVFLRGTSGPGGRVRPGFLRRWTLLGGLLFILYLPGFALLVPQILHPRGRRWLPGPTPDRVFEGLVHYAGSPSLLALLALLSLLAVVALARSGATGELYLLSAWFAVPLAAPIAISLLWDPMFHPRHGIAASLALYLLAAKGVEVVGRDVFFFGSFPRRTGRALKAGTIVIVPAALVLLSAAQLRTDFGTVDKQQWREAARYVDANARTGDLVLVKGRPGPSTAFAHYYPTRPDTEERSIGWSGGGLSEARRAMQKHDRIWRVGIHAPGRLKEDFFQEAGATQTRRQQYKGITLSLYERK